MRLPSRCKAYLLKSRARFLLTIPDAILRRTASRMLRKQMKTAAGGARGVGDRGDFGGGAVAIGDCLRMFQRRLAVACRPRNLVRFLGAVLVAALVILLVSKGLGSRRRLGSCRCAKFTYSQCQPYDGASCGQGVKKAFCQQKRCQPKRKLVRCSVPCAGDGPAGDAAESVDGGDGGSGRCIYSVRRQSIWSRCTDGAKHRSRILFLQSAISSPDCPPTKTERRSCRPSKPIETKNCIYEAKGIWSACDRQRNAIVNTRKLIDASGSSHNCPLERKTTMRCLKRDGTLKCIYSKWTKWSNCDSGIRYKTRSLIQGIECYEVTRIVQNCVQHQRQQAGPVSKDANSVIR